MTSIRYKKSVKRFVVRWTVLPLALMSFSSLVQAGPGKTINNLGKTAAQTIKGSKHQDIKSAREILERFLGAKNIPEAVIKRLEKVSNNPAKLLFRGENIINIFESQYRHIYFFHIFDPSNPNYVQKLLLAFADKYHNLRRIFLGPERTNSDLVHLSRLGSFSSEVTAEDTWRGMWREFKTLADTAFNDYGVPYRGADIEAAVLSTTARHGLGQTLDSSRSYETLIDLIRNNLDIPSLYRSPLLDIETIAENSPLIYAIITSQVKKSHLVDVEVLHKWWESVKLSPRKTGQAEGPEILELRPYVNSSIQEARKNAGAHYYEELIDRDPFMAAAFQLAKENIEFNDTFQKVLKESQESLALKSTSNL